LLCPSGFILDSQSGKTTTECGGTGGVDWHKRRKRHLARWIEAVDVSDQGVGRGCSLLETLIVRDFI